MPDGTTWIAMDTLEVASDVSKEYEGIGSSIRLNCTAFTSGMDYFIQGYNRAV